MSKVVRFPAYATYRANTKFVAESLMISDEEGKRSKWPVIVLVEEKTGIPLWYSGFERYLVRLRGSQELQGSTRMSLAFAVTRFLNYMWRCLEKDGPWECTKDDIRTFLIWAKKTNDGTEVSQEYWEKTRKQVLRFLELFHDSNVEVFDFKYNPIELFESLKLRHGMSRRKYDVKIYNSFGVSPPRKREKKSRALKYDHLRMLLEESAMYDVQLRLAIALQAFAGLREGEVVNLEWKDIRVERDGFTNITRIELDLWDEAAFWQGKSYKTSPGRIKKTRTQRVYVDFEDYVGELINRHRRHNEAKGYICSGENPVFLNKHGKPMTVHVYAQRLKALFTYKFVPRVREICRRNDWPNEHMVYLEAYEREYPGAHMLRHWFTMYLVTRTKRDAAEVMRWRGDSSLEAMTEYIHLNGDIIDEYEKSVHTYQINLLGDKISDKTTDYN